MTALTGTERLDVLGQNPTGVPAAYTFSTTTAAIAALADATNNPAVINTAITTAGAGTLTAAAIVGGVITRTGPTAVFSDAVDTAANIIAALTAYISGESFFLYIRNVTAFTQTITTATGVTLTGSVIIPAYSVGKYLVTVTAPTTVTILNIAVDPLTSRIQEVSTTLSTVGAGTITAAGIAGGITQRTGSQSGTAFTDTTDTAANIILAIPNAQIGISFPYVYKNNTDATATITGGTGVTVSSTTVIPANAQVEYLVSYTAAATITMVRRLASGMAADGTDQTKIMGFRTSGMTTGKQSLLAFVNTADAIYTYPSATDTVAGIAATQTLTNKTITDFIDTGDVVPSALTNIVSTTTLANIAGLSVAVTAAGKYSFRAFLQGTATANGGIKIAIANSGTTTSVTYTGKQFNGTTTNAASTTSTMGTAVAAATTVYTDATIEGVVVVNGAGNLTVQAAQNASHSDTTTVTVGSYFKVSRIA